MIDVRRVVDVVGAATAGVLSSPLWIGAALAVRLSSPGPLLHRAERIGRDGEPFTLLKFRTMAVDAASAGPAVTAGDDPRITPVGRWLRRTKVDELPQLLNVLRGDMSLVGPRPEDARYVETYSDADREVLSARPGVTGPASVAFRHEEQLLADADDLDAAYALIMADKLAIDIAYLRRRTVRSDLGILWQTARAVFD